jgi:hypothetical protein
MKTMRILGLAVTVAALVLLMSVPPASAQPTAGATYAGEIRNCAEPPCGTVQFKVSGNGLLVQDFHAYDAPGAGCRFRGPQPYPFDLDIVDDSFGPGPLDWYIVNGSFPTEDFALGTFRLSIGDPLCDTGVLDWTATVTIPVVGGIARLPDVSDSSAPNYLTPAALAAAALVALTAGGWYARRRFSRR